MCGFDNGLKLSGSFSDTSCSNVAEQLIEKGFASVVRHRRDDEDRSPDYDKLMAAEQTFVQRSQYSVGLSSHVVLLVLLRRNGASIPGRSNRRRDRL
jgi:hypothetical protein